MPPNTNEHPERKRFNRRSMRLSTADYGPGTSALITIVCHERRRHFGINERGTIIHSPAGIIAVETIGTMPEHHPCQIVASIVMPEHVHLLLTVLGMYRGKMKDRAFGRPVSGTIPVMINHFKGTVTRRIRQELPELGEEQIWQSLFHDRLIVHGADLTDVISYIHNNPMKHYLKEQYKKRMNDRNFGHGKGSKHPRRT